MTWAFFDRVVIVLVAIYIILDWNFGED